MCGFSYLHRLIRLGNLEINVLLGNIIENLYFSWNIYIKNVQVKTK